MSHEPRSQFDALLHGLQRDFMPHGMLENVLVEKLATDLWRSRRGLQVESAEAQKKIELVEEENSEWSHRALTIRAMVEKHMAETNRRGALLDIEEDPESLELCLDKLYTVREEANTYGLDRVLYSIDLGIIYGARYSGRPGRDLFDFYLECLSALKATVVERKKRGFASEVDCVKRFIDETEKEIRRLEGLHKEPSARQRSPHERKPDDIALLGCQVPDSPELDRLLRYLTTLERSFDRTLSQLERLQRMRLGQPVLPKVELQHSLS
jgi:hypothetical protein